jgi:hypothetical protein
VIDPRSEDVQSCGCGCNPGTFQEFKSWDFSGIYHGEIDLRAWPGDFANISIEVFPRIDNQVYKRI